MNEIMKADSICAYNEWAGVETLNPLVSYIDFSQVKPLRHARKLYGFYAVFLKDVKCGELKYGRRYYDYQEGTLIFVAPGQVFGAEDNGEIFQPTGHLLMFHPDLIRGTHLSQIIGSYTFFKYETNEALHLSREEREIVMDCFRKITYELKHPVDKHSKGLIVDNIKTFLDYCTRFYDRQFITRDNINRDLLAQFEKLLDGWFATGEAEKKGLPTVQWLADSLHLSASYMSDMLKKETGLSALNFIHAKTIDIAKTELAATEKSISEIAYQLGFQYPQHFTRLFKREVGCSPGEYRKSLVS